MRANHTLLGCLVALAFSARAAAADADHDIHFLSEHAPESAMDAHYASLPWPPARLARGEWRGSYDFSSARTSAELIDVAGPMFAFAAGTGIDDRRGYELLGFYSEMDVSGDGGRALLDPWFMQGVPLDVPARAEFTNPRGAFRHYGGGAALVLDRARDGTGRSGQLIVGVLFERLEVAGFAFDYRLLEGASAGATGVLDHSSSATLLTPLVGWQQARTLSDRWSWSPRALLVYPLTPGDFDARLAGPGFELATPRDGGGIEIGDPYFTLGLAIAHRPSGLEIDLGSTLFFAAGEHVSHDGVDSALMIHLAWRPGGRVRRGES